MPGWKTTFAVLAAVLAAGCSSDKKSDDSDTTTTFAQTLRGAWVACWNEGATDLREVVVFDGAGFVARKYDHPTSDESCGGAGVFRDFDAMSGGYTVGASVLVPDPDGVASVTAHELDAAGAVDSRYTIAYVKTSVTPNLLYMGDESGANDGSTPALRPDTLQARPRARAPAPAAFPASLQGSFESCMNEGFYDSREVLTLSGTSVDARMYDHRTTDGSCGGRGDLRLADSMQATLTLGANVDATLGTADVAAVAADVDPVLADTFYSIVWVDSFASPRTLYTGDENATPGLDSTAPDKRPTVLEQAKPRYLLPEPPAFPGILQGSWENCTYELDVVHDVREVFQFGATLTHLRYDHTTTDGTCGNGAGTLSGSEAFTFTLGATGAVTLGQLDVTAHALDLGTSLYTIVYVDTAAKPYTLYIGDERATEGLDGTAPDKRPTVLQEWKPRFRL